MSFKKAVGCGLVSIIAFVGLIVGVVFWATGGITETADDFFAATGSGDNELAYSLTSQGFKNSVSKEQLDRIITNSSFDEVTDTSWSSRSIENNEGTLSGTLTTASGGAIPVTVGLVKEGEEWKINYLKSEPAGVDGLDASGPAPSSTEQAEMVHSATTAFYRSLSQPDFSEFREGFVDSVSTEDIEQNFAFFRDFQPDLIELPVAQPEFEPADSLTSSGNLSVSGKYEFDDNIMLFEYVFSPDQSGEFKISGFDINLNP